MSEQLPSSLHAIAQVLREDHPLDANARQALAALIDELGNALTPGTHPVQEFEHLAESTTHLVQALQQEQEPVHVASARERFEAAILGLEARAPLTAGAARRFLDALANSGI
jgi:hypothetical protein